MNESKNTLPHYVIGTRGSLLALTQCLQMKALMEASKEATFSLKIIKTEGDENTQAPLWALDGKDFFTKELDHALLTGEVDLVVHSYKDLGSERPAGITLATITERTYAHDILFIRKEVRDALKEKKLQKFTVGTSSPRRMENLKHHLHRYLPYGEKVTVETKNLRGNVNTRLEKCVTGEYDAVTLALPGIERLAQGLQDENNEAYEKHGNPKGILNELIKNLDYMILPLGEFPAAASQGALAIECLEKRPDQGKLLSFLNTFNHQKTIEEVKEERRLFQTFGGGCHLAVGINVSTGPAGLRRSLAGAVDDTKVKELSLMRTQNLPPISGTSFVGLATVKNFDNATADELTQKEVLPISIDSQKFSDVLVTSPKVVDMAEAYFSMTEVSWWASGTKTMRQMAAKGVWVRGCADSLGEDHLALLRKGKLLNLFNTFKGWASLTHTDASSSLGKVLPLYKKSFKEASADYRQKIESCSLYYWTSATQYQHFKQNFNLNPKAVHACGLGKTYLALKENNLEATPVCSMSELRTWLNGE